MTLILLLDSVCDAKSGIFVVGMSKEIGVDTNDPAVASKAFEDQAIAAEAHAYNLSLSMGSKEVESLPRYVAELLFVTLEIFGEHKYQVCAHLIQGGPQPIFIKQPFLYNGYCETCMSEFMQSGCTEGCVLCGVSTENVQVVTVGVLVLFIPTCTSCKELTYG